MDGFKRFLGFQPNTKIAVLVSGLFHGLGLATKLQELVLSKMGLVTNIISWRSWAVTVAGALMKPEGSLLTIR